MVESYPALRFGFEVQRNRVIKRVSAAVRKVRLRDIETINVHFIAGEVLQLLLRSN